MSDETTSTPADDAALLDHLAGLDDAALAALAEQGRRAEEPPAFRRRSLNPAYLEAVASGAWTSDDESRLAQLVARAEAVTLGRVRRRDRRGLSRALRIAALSVTRSNLPGTNWPDRRKSPVSEVGPLPFPDRRAPR